MPQEPKSLFRHLLSDRISLRDYSESKLPSLTDVERRLFLLGRQSLPNLPDHYHRLSKERWQRKVQGDKRSESLGGLLVQGLVSLADEHLFLDKKIRKGREKVLVRVRAQKMNAWQELIAIMPPLVLQVSLLYRAYPLCEALGDGDYLTFYKDKILPNLRHTALPMPYIQQLETFMVESGGFHDLHIHLNGTTETDVAWQSFLSRPDQVYDEFSQALNRSLLAKEQFEESMSLFSDGGAIRNLLWCAQALRSYFFWVCCGSIHDDSLSDDSTKEHEPEVRYGSIQKDRSPFKNPEDVLARLLASVRKARHSTVYDEPFAQSYKHPFSSLLPSTFREDCYALATEGLMHYLLFHRLMEKREESLASMYHFYLLILGAFHQLIVQQPWQQGFDQFQKITHNDLRTYIERKSYEARFLQLSGNDYDSPQLRFLEGRFAPRDEEGANEKLLNLILNGWDVLKQTYSVNKPPELHLTAHFIKRPDESDRGIRHKSLRKALKRRSEALVRLREKNMKFREYVKGIDAASNELDASPEVFGPIFRYLRAHGFRHFTYHAGEEFYHLIGGMRAVYEAIIFCELQAGDRIGHAVALGLDPALWYESLGKQQFPMRRREYLDDLLFAHSFILEHATPASSLMSIILQLRLRIDELAEETYGKIYALRVLQQAWQHRKEDPLCEKSRYHRLEDKHSEYTSDEVSELLWKYHNERDAQSEIILVNPLELFSIEALSELQLLLLRYMCERELVIETLPTSNVRIGRYNTFDVYHLKRWLLWRREGKAIPSIVLGTDDPGIFATSIYNEYANVYCSLVNAGESPTDAMDLIRRMEQNAHIYNFAKQ